MEVESQIYTFSTLSLNRDEWSMPRPSQLTPANNPDNHCTGCCVGPESNTENMKISCLQWGLKPGPSSPCTFDIPNMLCRLCGLFHVDDSISEYITFSVSIIYSWRIRQYLYIKRSWPDRDRLSIQTFAFRACEIAQNSSVSIVELLTPI